MWEKEDKVGICRSDVTRWVESEVASATKS